MEMPFRLFTIGDLHIKLSNSIETDLMTTGMKQKLLEGNYDFTIILGDILDRFESIHVKPLTRAVNTIEEICKVSKHTFLLIGNHDRANNNVFLTDEHPFTGLRKWPNLTVVDTVIIKEIESEDGDKAEFVFIPYVAPGRLREALHTVGLDYPDLKLTSDSKSEVEVETESIPKVEVKVESKSTPKVEVKVESGYGYNEEGWARLQKMACVFAHQEFYGAKLGIKKSVEGDTWPLEAPLCISGHIHDYAQLQPNIYYVGTPIQHGANDITKKTLSSFTLSFDEQKAIWLQEETRHDLNVPKKIHVTLTVAELLAFEVPTNANFVRIDVEIDPVEYKQLLKNKHIKELLKAKVQIKAINTRKYMTKDRVHVANFKLSYAKRLEQNIKSEEKGVKDIYVELFGPLSKTPSPAKKKNVKPKKIRICINED